MAVKVGLACGVCPRCNKKIRRKRPADLAVCDCWKYCPTDHGKGAYGTLMQQCLPDLGFFGNKNEAGIDYSLNPDMKYGCRFELKQNARIAKIKVFARYLISAVPAKAAIYDDNNEKPNVLKASSSEVTIDSLTFKWFEFPISVDLTPGFYWITVLCDTYPIYVRRVLTSTEQLAFNSNVYDGFSDPFGTPSFVTNKLSMYAEYRALPPVLDLTPSSYGPIEVVSGTAWGDLKSPMKILYVCPICNYHSAQKPVEVRLS